MEWKVGQIKWDCKCLKVGNHLYMFKIPGNLFTVEDDRERILFKSKDEDAVEEYFETHNKESNKPQLYVAQAKRKTDTEKTEADAKRKKSGLLVIGMDDEKGRKLVARHGLKTRTVVADDSGKKLGKPKNFTASGFQIWNDKGDFVLEDMKTKKELYRHDDWEKVKEKTSELIGTWTESKK